VNSIARAEASSNDQDGGRCENPIRVVLGGMHPGALSAGTQRRLIDTLRRRWIGRAIVEFAKRVRGDPKKFGSRPSCDGPIGVKPKGGSSDGRFKSPSVARDFRKVWTQEPRPAWPVWHFGVGCNRQEKR